jgi:acetylornithine deacetylase/succinyl-diaminopimelate desuccinylase-like protein
MKRPWFACAVAIPLFGWAATPPPSALEILQRSVAFQTLPGNGQIPAYAQYLRGLLLDAGYAATDIRIDPLGDGSEATATFTARLPGRQPAKKPLLLIAHMDVVPARREDWERDPFTAVLENGYVYGRGAKDNKFDLTMMVATLAKLRRSGFRPDRDVILALTGDEETTGEGAMRLARQYANAELVLNGDSGGGRLAEDGSGALTYTLQGGEKTYTDMTLTVTDAGGHSSRPTQTNAIYALSRALSRIGAHRFPLQSSELTTAFFEASAAVTPGETGDLMRRYVANPADAEAVEGLARRPDLVGQLRTTCVATQVNAGHAPNALPQRATANVNCRLFPGTSAHSVRQTLADVIADPAVVVTFDPSDTHESPASPLRADVLRAVTKAVRTRHPMVPVVPFMSPGATDGRYFRAAGVPTYAVSGLFIKPSDDFAHGLNERVPVAAIEPALAHWESLIRDLSR